MDILLAATEENSDGEIATRGFHRVKRFDLKAAQSAISGKELGLYQTLGRLMFAYRTENEGALREALDALPEEPGVIYANKRSQSGKPFERARWEFADIMGRILKRAEFTTWFPYGGKQICQTGLFCESPKTAALVSLVLGSIRICPHCVRPFTPRASNIVFCTYAHGNAYRVAHHRANKKQKVQ